MLHWILTLALCMGVTLVVFFASTRPQRLLGESAITAVDRSMGLVLTHSPSGWRWEGWPAIGAS